ncbi:MAG: mannose-6-phosphate isomerase, partial [Mesorhizobium sp.]
MSDNHHQHERGHAHQDREDRWKHNGVRVIKGDQLDPNTAQTPGMYRQAAINHARVGAQKIWAGTV